MSKYSKKAIIEALYEAKGIISVAARTLDCERQTIYNRMEKDEDIRKAREDAKNVMLDHAENALFNLIESQDHKDHFKALKYYLSLQGQSRGYGREDDSGLSEYLKKLNNALQPLPEAETSD